MSFGNEDREFARPVVMPDWLENFANSELKKEGNPFEDIRNLFQQKTDITAVEDRVKELCERVGLDKIEKHAAKDDIFGGFGDGESDKKFDPEQLEKGVKVELEHTDSPEKAKEIAKDHLMESKDFEGGDGAKYYDKLEEMEEEMGEDLTKKKSMLARFILIANRLEDAGDVKAARAMDKLIIRFAESFAKDKEDIFDKHPELQRIIDEVCISRGGFVDTPAVMQMLQSEQFKDVKLSDKDKKQLEKYIKTKIKDTKKDIKEDGVSGMNYVVFVVTEDDGNSDIFSGPGM